LFSNILVFYDVGVSPSQQRSDGLWLGGQGSNPGSGKFPLLFMQSDIALTPQKFLMRGLDRLFHETEHSSPSTAQLNKVRPSFHDTNAPSWCRA
jgi:hypothetical protein